MQKDTKLIFKNYGKNYKIKAHDRKDTQNMQNIQDKLLLKNPQNTPKPCKAAWKH